MTTSLASSDLPPSLPPEGGEHPSSGTVTTVERIIFVLGSPRSGTSLLTHVLGVVAGSLPNDPLPAHEMNEEGFWEPAEIVRLHEELLAAIGCTWKSMDHWDLGRLTPADRTRFETQLWQAFENNFAGARVAILKDPRITRLFPLWRELAARHGVAIVVAITHRAPEECARSIGHRFELGLPQASALWARYMLEAERTSRDVPRAFIEYDRLLDDWRAALAPAAERLGIDLSALPEEVQRRADTLARRDLRHYTAGTMTLPHVAAEVSHLFAHVQDDQAIDETRADALGARLDDAGDLFHDLFDQMADEAIAIRRTAEMAGGELTQLHALAERLDQELVTASNQITLLDKELVAAADQIARLDAYARSLDEALVSTRQHESELEAAQTALTEDAHAAIAYAASLTAALDAEREGGNILRRRVEQLDAEVERLNHHLTEVGGHYAAAAEQIGALDGHAHALLAAREAAAAHIAGLEAAIAELRVYADSLTEALAAARQHVAVRVESNAEIAGQAATEGELRATLEAARAETAAQRDRADDLARRNEALENDVAAAAARAAKTATAHASALRAAAVACDEARRDELEALGGWLATLKVGPITRLWRGAAAYGGGRSDSAAPEGVTGARSRSELKAAIAAQLDPNQRRTR